MIPAEDAQILAERFGAEIANRSSTSFSSAPELGPRLLALFQQSAAAWPGVVVSASEFIAQLAQRLPAGVSAVEFVDTVKGSDLYLTCGCLRAAPAALEAFDSRYLSQVGRFLSRLSPSPDLIAEVTQRLRVKLLIAPPDEVPKLAAYSGRGTLLAFLRISAVRIAINLRRDRHLTAANESDGELEAVAQGLHQRSAPVGEQELELIKKRHAAAFASAIRDAFATISSKQRSLLRMHFVLCLTEAQMAATLHVHQSTVNRWLAAARAAVFDETRRLLHARLQLSQSELDSMIALLRSKLDLSLTELLSDKITP